MLQYDAIPYDKMVVQHLSFGATHPRGGFEHSLLLICQIHIFNANRSAL